MIVLVVCLTVSLVLVLLRIYTRLFILRKRFWEDLILVIAMVCWLGFYSVFFPTTTRAELRPGFIAARKRARGYAKLTLELDLVHHVRHLEPVM